MKVSYPLNRLFMLLGIQLLSMLTVHAADRIGLESFSAKWENNLVVLKWSAVLEKNFSHFAIERSVDGQEFKELALYFTEEVSLIKCNYAFTDKFLPSKQKVLYYRLRLINKDGSIQYSNPKEVSLATTETLRLTLYPNPVQQVVFVALPRQWNRKEVVLELYNGNGQLLKSRVEKNTAVTIAMELGELPAGWYLLKAQTAEASLQGRLVKME